MALKFFLPSSLSKVDRHMARMCKAFRSYVSKVDITVPRSSVGNWRTQIRHVCSAPTNIASLDTVSSAHSPLSPVASFPRHSSLLLHKQHAARLISGDATLHSSTDRVSIDAMIPVIEAAGGSGGPHDQDIMSNMTVGNEDMQRLITEYKESSKALKSLPDHLRQIPQADPRGTMVPW